jgi:CTP synthase (UTP-ammonia lyase)
VKSQAGRFGPAYRRAVHIVVLIDLPEGAPYRRATAEALRHAATARGAALGLEERHTDDEQALAAVDRADGLVIGPGSPYRDEERVWEIVRTARERDVPLVGT